MTNVGIFLLSRAFFSRWAPHGVKWHFNHAEEAIKRRQQSFLFLFLSVRGEGKMNIEEMAKQHLICILLQPPSPPLPPPSSPPFQSDAIKHISKEWLEMNYKYLEIFWSIGHVFCVQLYTLLIHWLYTLLIHWRYYKVRKNKKVIFFLIASLISERGGWFVFTF